MRLDYVEVGGFRGFRRKLRVDFGKGFTVISGRNGVGKSTLCDAIEFALTGSISKYRVERAALESLEDYLWWRGHGSPEAHHVCVAFRKDDGQQFTITRTREGGSDRSPQEIEDALCPGSRPDEALHQLCRTSIIRDEWIADLSVDLTETERFEFVRSALGPPEGSDRGSRAREVIKKTEAIHARNERAYEAARAQLADSLSQLSEAQDAASRLGDIGVAMRVVDAAVPETPPEMLSRLTAGRAALVTRRAKLDRAGEAFQQARELATKRQLLDAPEARQRREAARLALAHAAATRAEAEQNVVEAERNLGQEERADAIAASLTLLIEHGEQLGLHDSRCPLCAAARTLQEFESGLAIARKRVDSLASGVAAARRSLDAARATAKRPFAEYAAAEDKWQLIIGEEAHLAVREREVVELFERAGLDSRFVRELDGLEREMVAERDQLIELERALLTLEASQVVSRAADLEERTGALRKDVERAAERMEQSRAAVETSKSIERAVRRVSGEIMDERLARISPLLNELYQRLRPHADWRTIDYRIRGDVRRFLSLRVGDALNPQFVLSSGQRRAAGLAFLLSVHLARAWTPWRTLILDDPVQHIDDFRALQFVEILAATLLDGRQIVCTVEDRALAELLCRRLLSTTEQTGRRYDIDLDSEGVAAVVAEVEVPPLPASVLHRISSAQVAG